MTTVAPRRRRLSSALSRLQRRRRQAARDFVRDPNAIADHLQHLTALIRARPIIARSLMLYAARLAAKYTHLG